MRVEQLSFSSPFAITPSLMNEDHFFPESASNSCLAPVLYLGDTDLGSAAAYLAGVLAAAGLEYRYVPSHIDADAAFFEEPTLQVVVISDYPAARLGAAATERLLARVQDGLGLVFLGGWESYHGLEGFWHQSPLAEALPVSLESQDDRVNYDQLAVVALADGAAEHSIVAGLPWNERPPTIGGFNRFTPKPGSVTLLECWLHELRREGATINVQRTTTHPLLTVGSAGKGRIACLATDAAPHWVGPLVDWGTPRLSAQGPGAGAIEVGAHYARFLQQLVRWAGGL